jgi:hypothetical protein
MTGDADLVVRVRDETTRYSVAPVYVVDVRGCS